MAERLKDGGEFNPVEFDDSDDEDMLVQDLPAFFGHVAEPAVVGTSRGTEIAELDDTEPEDSDDDEEFAT